MSGYLREADRWLDAMFADLADEKITLEAVKRDIRNRLLESYKNGLKAAGQSPAPRDRKPRRVPERTFAN